MRKLIASEFMTLDGVMEAPGQEQHPDGKNAWALQHATEDIQRFKVEEVFAVDAILLGRVTYQIWAAFWPSALVTMTWPTGSTPFRNTSSRRV